MYAQLLAKVRLQQTCRMGLAVSSAAAVMIGLLTAAHNDCLPQRGFALQPAATSSACWLLLTPGQCLPQASTRPRTMPALICSSGRTAAAGSAAVGRGQMMPYCGHSGAFWPDNCLRVAAACLAE
eukprot:GHRQ01033244.1.p1 GENE.GHRQ01033244.1~~GHRQ01033244.1.p1  ORF type:complete len:125 (+),score=37.09 GHRQ01033244.1:165-539(+)